MRRTASSLLAVLLAIVIATVPAASAAPLVADHHAADAFDAVPAPWFQVVRDHYRLFYGRTSHGSQVETGLEMLAAADPVRWAGPTMTLYGSDLGTLGELDWVTATRSHLAGHPECNAVMWSWCGGVSVNTPEGIDAYLQAMDQLESDFPGVRFIYMTGHLDGTGPEGLLYQNNDRIRAWCTAHDKTLFDFADIESWDPGGTWYPDGSDACEWCADWCDLRDCPGCGDCAHSHCFNCYRKGRAFWWLLARDRGWQPGDLAVGPAAGGQALSARPNPFGRATKLVFTLAEPAEVRLRIVDTAGRAVATLAEGRLGAGRHEFSWSGRTANGTTAPAGVYFARLLGPGSARTERLVLRP